MKNSFKVALGIAFALFFVVDSPSYGGRRGSGSVGVRGYYRKNGTYVRPHVRTAPDGNCSNNISGCSSGGNSRWIPSGTPSYTPSIPSRSDATPEASFGNSSEAPFEYLSPSESEEFLSREAIPFKDLISDGGRIKVQSNGVNLSYFYLFEGKVLSGYVNVFSSTDRMVIGKFKDINGFGCRGEVTFKRTASTRWESNWKLIPYQIGDKCDGGVAKILMQEKMIPKS